MSWILAKIYELPTNKQITNYNRKSQKKIKPLL